MPDTPNPSSPAPRSDGSGHSGHSGHSGEELTLHVGKHELIVRQRYEAVSVANDILISVWFLIGSIMFFSPNWTHTGTWCFVLGSVELMVRPGIRLSRQLHIQRLQGGRTALSTSSQDY